VLAHELAHISLRHVGQRASGLPAAIDLSKWQTEFAADEHGFRMMAAAFPSVRTEVQYIGPVLLFEIVDLVGGLLERANPEAAADIENYAMLLVHPSASARVSSLINGTFGRGPQQVRFAEVDAELGIMAPDLPLVDDLVARMRRIRAGTVARAHAEDVERLRRFASGCDRARYNAVFQIGQEREGVAQIDAGAVIDLIEDDHEQAQAWIAFAACMCLAIGPAMSHAFRSHLGFMNTLYRVKYLEPSSGRSMHAQRFQNLLKACIPDLADAEFDAARELHGQRLRSSH
jgi:hypothetical protein